MRKKTIGIFIPNVHKIGRHEYFDAICQRAEKYNLNTMCFSSYTDLYNRDDFDKGEESIYYLALKADLAALVIYSELIKSDEINRMLINYGKRNNIPVFTIDKRYDDTYYICYDYDKAFERVTDHVIEKHGAKNIYMMSGLKDNNFSETRNEAYRRSLEKHGIKFDESKIYYGQFWENPTREAVKEILADPRPLPDAIVCANDTMAIEVCNVLADNGIYVPGDMIVTGFDGIERATQNFPTITTAKYDYRESSNFIVDKIYEICCGEPIEPRDFCFESKIQLGQSCSCVDSLQCTTGKITSELYELVNSRSEFRQHMDHMTLSYSNAKDIKECFAELQKYVSTVIYKAIAVYLDPKFFGIPECGDSMVLAAYISNDSPKYYTPFTAFDSSLIYSPEIFGACSDLLFVPLHCQDRVYGYVAADYSFMDVHAGERLSDFVVHMNMLLLNIENAAKLKETVNALNNMYIRDPLTNLLNRRGFYRDVDMLVFNATQRKSAIMLISVDLNGLKYINDNFGHSEGDYAIVAVADLLASLTEQCGICARFGGDEYLAAIYGNETAERFEERFNTELARLNENVCKPYPISASMGIEIITPEEALDSLQDAIRRADDKMFLKKKESKLSRRQISQL